MPNTQMDHIKDTFDLHTYGCIISGWHTNVETFNENIVAIAVCYGAPQGLLVEATEYKNMVTWRDDTDAAQKLNECADEAIEWLNDNDPYGSWELYESALYRVTNEEFEN